MKRLILLIGIVFLVACGNETTKDEPEETTEAAQSEVSEESKVEETEPVEEEATEEAQEDGKLQEVGDKIENDPQTGGTVELMGIKEINETVDLNPIKLTIKNIKMIRMSDVTDSYFLHLISGYTDKETFDYVQIVYEIENMQDINVRLSSPINAIVLDTGEQIESFDHDFSMDPNFAKTLYGKVRNESFVSLIMESDPAEVNEIKIITGRIDDEDSSTTIVDEQSFSYKLK